MSQRPPDQPNGQTTKTDALGSLRNPLFRRLWLGNMVANLGTMFQSVGAAWIMMTMTGSPQMVAFVQSSLSMPFLLLSLLSGVLADSFDRRRIMLIAQCYMFAMAAGLTLLMMSGGLTPTLLLLFTFLIGCGGALHMSSWQASVREIVDRSDLASAVAVHSMGFNLVRSAGPALGGVILALTGASVLFVLNAVCYLVLISLLVTWRRPHRKISMRESLQSALLSGLRYSAMSPKLVNVIARGTLFATFAISFLALLPVIAGTMLGGDSALFGTLLGCFGLGAVVAAFTSTAIRDRFSTEQIVRVTFLAFGGSFMLIALTGQVYTTIIAAFIAGGSWVLTNSTLNVTVQLSTPMWVAGRSLSILHTGIFGGMAIGSLGWGLLAEAAGIKTALIVSSIALLTASFMGKFMPLPPIVDERLEPANSFREPDLNLDLSQLSGPISVAIHYRISPEDVPEFLSVMKQRRQVRRRDGAHRWALQRDVEHSDHWSETYRVRTWDDYIRHNHRRTEVDAAIQERLWSLHRGQRAPVVLRMVEWEANSTELPKEPDR